MTIGGSLLALLAGILSTLSPCVLPPLCRLSSLNKGWDDDTKRGSIMTDLVTLFPRQPVPPPTVD